MRSLEIHAPSAPRTARASLVWYHWSIGPERGSFANPCPFLLTFSNPFTSYSPRQILFQLSLEEVSMFYFCMLSVWVQCASRRGMFGHRYHRDSTLCVRIIRHDLPMCGFNIVPGLPLFLLFEPIIPSLGNNTSDIILSVTRVCQPPPAKLTGEMSRRLHLISSYRFMLPLVDRLLIREIALRDW